MEEIHVGNLIVGCTVRLKSNGEICTVLTVHPNPDCLELMKADGSQYGYGHKPGENRHDVQIVPAILPAKQLRENTIETLDLSNKGLGVDGGLMLAALMAGNDSTKVLHAQNNGLGPEGAKSFGSMLEHNSTLTLLDVSGNNMGAEGAAALANAFSLFDTKCCCFDECQDYFFSGDHYENSDGHILCQKCFSTSAVSGGCDECDCELTLSGSAGWWHQSPETDFCAKCMKLDTRGFVKVSTPDDLASDVDGYCFIGRCELRQCNQVAKPCNTTVKIVCIHIRLLFVSESPF
jgi:hypothetical protein